MINEKQDLFEHPFICRRCKKPFMKDGIILKATINKFTAKWKCPRCRKFAYLKRPEKCWYCGTLFSEKQWPCSAIARNEAVESDAPCDVCIKEIGMLNKIVEEGGAFYTCSNCKGQGVVKKCEAIDNLREKMDTPIPRPLAITLPQCKDCNPDRNAEAVPEISDDKG